MEVEKGFLFLYKKRVFHFQDELQGVDRSLVTGSVRDDPDRLIGSATWLGRSVDEELGLPGPSWPGVTRGDNRCPETTCEGLPTAC